MAGVYESICVGGGDTFYAGQREKNVSAPLGNIVQPPSKNFVNYSIIHTLPLF